MIQNSGINIGLLAEAEESQKERTDKLFNDLFEEARGFLDNNPLYRGFRIYEPILLLLLLAGMVFGFIKRELAINKLDEYFFSAGMPDDVREELMKHLDAFLVALIILLAVILLSNLLRSLYSFVQRRRYRKISSCRKTAEKRIASKDMGEFRTAAAKAVEEGNMGFSAGGRNDIGKRIGSIRDQMMKAERRSKVLRGIFAPLFAAAYYLFGFAVIWLMKDKLGPDCHYTFAWLVLFGAYTFFAIDFVLCSIGSYLGKLMRPFGCLLAALYAGFLWYLTGEIDADFFGSAALTRTGITEFIPQLKISHVVVLLQLIAMLTGILAGDYPGMRKKWINGSFSFDIDITNKTRTRGSVIRRMLWSVPWVLLAWYCGMKLSTISEVIIFVLVWWRSMPLFKPCGSVIYAFFGRGKCISMALMSFALYIMICLSYHGSLDFRMLKMIGISLAAYLVLSVLVFAINAVTGLFVFLRRFV